MNRREFLHAGMATAATLAVSTPQLGLAAAAGAASTPGLPTRIDTNVTLFQWPGRRLPGDDTPSLLQRMGKHRITLAWAGSFEGILQRDIAGVNARLADACRASGGRLLPFGSINLALPNWEADVQRCAEAHQMRGVRLHPNYHGYDLRDARFKQLLKLATERRLLVQIACSMEDTRTHNPLLTVPDVDLAPLPDALAAAPAARVQLLNNGRGVESAAFEKIIRLPNVFVDTARIESVGGVGRVLRKLPAGRVLFGSHAPFFIYESAVLKLFESQLTPAELNTLLAENPRAALYA